MAYTSKYKFAEIEAILDASNSTGAEVDIKLDGLFENALQEKNVKVSGDTEIVPDAGFLGMKKVNVSVASEVSPKDVNFRDYDGTILHSYTKDEFLALNEFPPLPTQKGLICQEWNWAIAEAKEYVAEYGVLEVGATYITDDGKTRLYIHIAADGRMNVPLYFSQTTANGVTIDWGDGSSTQTLSGTGKKNTTHTYASVGDYVISLDVKDECILGLGHNSSSYSVMGSGTVETVYCTMLQAVEIGKGVTSIGNYAFSAYYSLSSIVIPNSVTSIGKYAFQTCPSLSSIVIPNSVTSIGSNAFYACYSLSSIVFPNSVTSIEVSAFSSCYSLSSIVIPNSLTRIGNYVFQTCFSLSSIVISNSVTSIEGSAFQNCYSLSSIVFPNSVTRIEAYAFQNCNGMAYYDFRDSIAVPTLSSTNAFANIQSDCKIVVPDALYDEWIAATNWSTYASYIVKASEFNA